MDLAAVHDWVDTLARLDAAGGDPAELESAAGLVRRLRNWLDAREVTIASGLRSRSGFPEKNLADGGMMSLRNADRVVERVAATEAAPLIAAALDEGRASGRHVDVYQRIAAQLPAAARELFEADQARHALIAAESTVEEFSRALRRDAERLHHGAAPDGCPVDPVERQGFLRAHALLAVVDGGGVRLASPQAVVVVHGDLHGNAVIDYDLPVDLPDRVVEQLLGRAEVRAVVVNDGTIVSAPGRVALGRASRCANLAQRMALRAIYRTCALPGCTVPVRMCEAHHVNEGWADGGPTDLDNLAPVCKHHHDVIHQRRWKLHMSADRSITATLPTGEVMSTGPPSLAGP